MSLMLLQAAARKMAERLRLEETLQALEAAVGGKWDEGQELDLSSDVSGSLENVPHDPINPPPLINRSRSSHFHIYFHCSVIPKTETVHYV